MKKSIAYLAILAMIFTLFTVPALAYEELPETIDLSVTYRDFHGTAWGNPGPDGYYGHPDFEMNPYYNDPGIVENTLCADRKPIYSGESDNPSTHGPVFFNMWYNDDANYNINVPGKLTFTKTGDVYTYTNNSFFPLDGLGFDAIEGGTENTNHNYHFTMEMHSRFTYQPGQTFSFTGDDDVWVFINNQLVIDLGGVHQAMSASVDLDYLGLIPGNVYNFDLFFAERHTVASNFFATTNIELEDEKVTDNICGYKLNGITGEPIEGVRIILEKQVGVEFVYEDETITDADGKYYFIDLPPGTYRVTEDADGWVQVYPEDSHIVTLPSKDVIYGIQRNTGKIFEINPLTADATEYYQISGAVPFSNVGPNGLAYDQSTGELYFTTYRGLAKLYVTDDPTEEYLGELEGEIACADFFNGKYYYIAGGTHAGYGGPTDDLYEVTFDPGGSIADISKFESISADQSAWTFDGDIAISADGVIYGFGKNNLLGGGYEFFRVNRDGTGFNLIRKGYDLSLQLAFGGDGVLYGHDAKYGRFFVVDTVDGSIAQISDGANNYTDTASGIVSYNFENEPALECYDETAWAAQDNPGENRFIPAPGNWATYIEVSREALSQGILEFPLYAGQTHHTGTLLVKNDGGVLKVNYVASEQDDGYLEGYRGVWTGLTEIHLQVEDEFDGFNAVRTYNKKTGIYGSPIPGQFEIKANFDPKQVESGWIDAGSLDRFQDDDIFIAAHAVMWWSGYPFDPDWTVN
ncbi:MAG: fibro-slime domain-containing protein [Eubacteriales bacterium]|nr:fibro-slime domain-containing protein [Eubacteriales bacterium]MDD4583520.1 fibro-slime domain-containing protein [Eubacteriales bacterium]